MEERINKKLEYLNEMADKYLELNRKTHCKYQWRLNAIFEDIRVLENLQYNITNEWDEAYQEDLEESKVEL
ncbi:conserved hypothetical protein [Clostridium neonatale]|uniref:hypothetical protein n=1 Tax=Clostridium neonatale TaxID=137838 RepID=UPI00291C2AFB|nr:hypothetical protein [Clostridium neonatale]CAI3605093.1 conserved hypothetical protein [Clostridium neonatale]